ncbi:MAG: hypothetical protein ABIH67_02935 [Candidatus Uhrbacteria bacterium]
MWLTCCELKSSDGIDQQEWCIDGDKHVTFMPNFDGLGPFVNPRPCDGSCALAHRQQVDVGALIEEMRQESLTDQGQDLLSRVQLDTTLKHLLQSRASLIGAEFARFYTKRNSQGQDLCTGSHHIKVITNFDWWNGQDTGFYQTHRLSASVCDGSCHSVPEGHYTSDAELMEQLRAVLET